MVNTMNKSFFAGRRMLTFTLCHRGSTSPETTAGFDAPLRNAGLSRAGQDGESVSRGTRGTRDYRSPS